MNGTYLNIYGLTFDSALKICTKFDEYTVINKRKSFFRDGEVDLALKQSYYRITTIEENVGIEELKNVINESGKEEWIVTARLSIPRDSFSYMEIK